MTEKYLHLAQELGEETVQQLREKVVTVVGLGGMGSTLAELLVRSGIGVRLIEKDRVFQEDIDRLSLFREADLTKFKATQAKKILGKINSEAMVKSFNEEITPDSMFLVDADVVMICIDDAELIERISEYCFKKKLPCGYGSVRDKRVIVATSTDKKSIFDQIKNLKIDKTEGLLPAYTHLAAGFMYVKTIKLLTDSKPRRGVLVYNAWKQCFENKRGKKK